MGYSHRVVANFSFPLILSPPCPHFSATGKKKDPGKPKLPGRSTAPSLGRFYAGNAFWWSWHPPQKLFNFLKLLRFQKRHLPKYPPKNAPIGCLIPPLFLFSTRARERGKKLPAPPGRPAGCGKAPLYPCFPIIPSTSAGSRVHPRPISRIPRVRSPPLLIRPGSPLLDPGGNPGRDLFGLNPCTYGTSS